MNSQFITGLDNQYKTLITLSEKPFFVGLANYVRSVNNNSDTAELVRGLHKQIQVDYDEVKSNEYDYEKDRGESKTLEDYLQQAKRLGQQHRAFEKLQHKQQTSPAHAWLKLQLLQIMIDDPQEAERLYGKSEKAKYEYRP